MSQLPMYPPQQHDVVGPDSQGTPARKITRPWLAYLQSLTTNVVNSVTHTGALVLNRLIVGNGGQDIRAEALNDGQIPIGATSDGTVQPATITAGANIAVTNGAHSITIAATGVVTGPAGANTDIQYNDSGVFGGDAHLTWDKTTQQQTVTGTGLASPIRAATASSGDIALSPLDAGDNDITLGAHADAAGNWIPAGTTLLDLFQHDNEFPTGSRAGGFEVAYGLTPSVPDPFTHAVGVIVRTPTDTSGDPINALELYQYGGLGTGAVPGMAILADRNDSGGGATGVIGGQLKDGRWFVIWADATGAMRYSIGASLAAIRPTEDNSVSDTSGTLFGTSQPYMPLTLGDEPPTFVTDGAGRLIMVAFTP